MKAKVKSKFECTLTLDREETIWLHGYMQNAYTEDEDSDSAAMRNQFFHTTGNALKDGGDTPKDTDEFAAL